MKIQGHNQTHRKRLLVLNCSGWQP